MEIKTNYIPVTKTARFSTLGVLNKETKYVWLALHGSKMRCEQMLYKFKDFNLNNHFIIAPEGLNRQYENGFGGDVVSSWMTKRDRLKEIEDFSNYLNSLLESFKDKLPADTIKIVFGFSQGGTTAFRWLHNTTIYIDHFIAYSCWIPEDINLKESQTKLDSLKMYYTYGIQDEFLTEKRIAEINEIIQQNNLNINIEPYPGTHRIDRSQLVKLFESYIKK